MDIKVSQKKCKSCNISNPIRCMKCKNCGYIFDSKSGSGQEVKKKNEKKSIIDYFNNTEAIKKTATPIIENKVLKDFLESVKNNPEESDTLPKLEETITLTNPNTLLLDNHDFSYSYACDLGNYDRPIFAITYYDIRVNSFVLKCMEFPNADDQSELKILRKRYIKLKNIDNDNTYKMNIKLTRYNLYQYTKNNSAQK